MQKQGTIRIVIGSILLLSTMGTLDADQSVSLYQLAILGLSGIGMVLSGMSAKGLIGK